MAKSPSPGLALPRIDREEKVLDLKLRLKGKAAVDLLDYQRAYEAAYGEKVDLDVLVLFVLAAFLEADRGFQAARKAGPSSESAG
jgi:hypothetical protein